MIDQVSELKNQIKREWIDTGNMEKIDRLLERLYEINHNQPAGVTALLRKKSI